MSDLIGILTTPLLIALTHDEWSKTGTMGRSRTMTWRESWWLDGARGQSTGPTLSYFCSCCEIGERASAISCNHKGGIMGWNPDKLGEVASYSILTHFLFCSGIILTLRFKEIYFGILKSMKRFLVYIQKIFVIRRSLMKKTKVIFYLLLLINGN